MFMFFVIAATMHDLKECTFAQLVRNIIYTITADSRYVILVTSRLPRAKSI
jgi:hypothetical protein